MEDVLGYKGKKVVVSGAFSGMGHEVARILVELGAEVSAVDIKPTDVPGAEFIEIDLRDPSSIESAAAKIDGPLHALFSCAGLPGPPFSELDTVLVNFVGARHLAEALLPKIVAGGSISAISSCGAIGWERTLEQGVLAMLGTKGFDGALEWLNANEEKWSFSGYAFSKWCTDAWVGYWYPDLVAQDVRINATNPGPTATPMMPAFHDFATKAVVDASMGPIGRYAEPAEQAWPLVMLGSPRMSYVSGEVLWVDGGFLGGLTTGRVKAAWTEQTEEHTG